MQSEIPVRRARPFWMMIILMIILLVLLIFVGGPAVGILAAIAFPPGPPLPPGVTEISHTNLDYGVDEWTLTSNQNACEIPTFYQEQGGVCIFPPGGCPTTEDSEVARCGNVYPISIFALRWEVTITTGSTAGSPAQLQVQREMLWSGMPLVSPQPES
ncbi:MAG: hypothetical protein H6672_11605 [Anaerolineaceae bacterium]|nr:hypothetical protein [Anaerolineaceae bacterium]